jgi:predicted nucleotidyltransferase
VLELPSPFAVSSAERFARGGVALLAATGVPMTLCFGSECGDGEKLRRVAQTMSSDAAAGFISRGLKKGVSYAAAMQSAADALLGEDAAVLRNPNDLLAVEYAKAVAADGLDMELAAFPRVGPAHDGDAGDGYASASYIRGALAAGEDVSAYVPEQAMEIYRREMAAGRMPVDITRLETAMLYRLRTMTAEDYAALPDASEGLDARFEKFGRRESTVEGVIDAVKTKRYARSRLRRMALCALLGITADMQEGGPKYLRVLAFNSRGQSVLRRMRLTASLPVITKPAAAKLLPGEAGAAFKAETGMDDIYALACPEPSQRGGGRSWTQGPAIIE